MREKLYEFLCRHPQGVPSEELLQVVLTAPGKDRQLSTRLLHAMIGMDDRFILNESEGLWSAAPQENASERRLEDTTFVVVDLETTSLGTNPHNIIEFAAARVRNGKLIDEFSQLVDPGISLPPFIVQLTGITDSMLAGQPNLFDVWPRFREFIGNDVLVAHNANFDMGFLNAVATLRDGGTLPNPILCTLKLARRLLPDLRRRGLDALATHFAIPQLDRHRAAGDVRITIEVLFHFIDTLQQRGITRLGEVLEFQHQASDGQRFESHLPREKIQSLPNLPGIYRLFDAEGKLLYVGRAKNLGERLQSYLSNSSRHSAKTLALIRQAYDVRVEIADSELEAALEEAAAIQQEKPPFNRLAKHLPRIAFVKLTYGDRFPRLAITAKLRRGHSRYFGPFAHRDEAEQVIGLLTRLFRLRTCSPRLEPSVDFKPCFEGQSGSCTAPCAAAVTSSQYREQVEECLQLLEGDALKILPTLLAKREAQVEALQFEAADRTQRDITLLHTVARKQKARRWITRTPSLLILQPSGLRPASRPLAAPVERWTPGSPDSAGTHQESSFHYPSGGVRAYVILNGILTCRAKLYQPSDVDSLWETIHLSASADQAQRPASAGAVVDGMTIVAAWLRDHGERDGYIFELETLASLEDPKTKRPATLEEWRAACADLLGR